MALGQYPSLVEINTEISTTGQSLVTCIANAGKTGVFTKQSDFAYYVHSYLTVNKSSMTFDNTGQPTQTFDITSNVSWTLAKSQSWILMTTTGGSGNATKDVDCIDNFGSQRSGTITVSWSGTDRVIDVTQNA